MEEGELQRALEAILFAAGEPVEVARLAMTLETDPSDIEKALEDLSGQLSFDRRGVRILKLENAYQMVSSGEMADYVTKALETRKPPKLSASQLETLTIIAYYQPATKALVEQIRGVDSSYSVSALLNKKLIEEAGRLNVPGRPIQYRTTADFLRTFAIGSLDELPPIDKVDLTDQAACKEAFADVDGIIVPGGFGDRGIEGMIQAAQYARENHVPYFGICLGMQIMVMEFARGVLGYKDANSSEFTPDGKHNVIALMADQQGNIPKGGTMRLGKYPCKVMPGTKMAECYGEAEIWERHRHRYEFNNEFRQEMQDAGLVISGTSPDGRLVETVELPGRDFHLGAQFHPEFKSRPNRAHPLFKAFIAAALKFRASEQRSLLHM